MTEFIVRAIADPIRPRITARTLLVFAHPDDETLACGALLPRLQDMKVVHVTDGAPRNGDDARRHGFANPSEYAATRRAEVVAAMAMAGVPEQRLTCLGIADQGSAFALANIAYRLVPLLDCADLVITHAYEGGHPDHDAVCWAVRAALDLMGRRPALLEVPLYRLGQDGGWQRQAFDVEENVVVLRLTDAERALKTRMIAAHATQVETLRGFGVADEPYRLAPKHDFAELPNGGALLYEHYGWGLTGRHWLDLAAAAGRDLAAR